MLISSRGSTVEALAEEGKEEENIDTTSTANYVTAVLLPGSVDSNVVHSVRPFMALGLSK
jgi:hypothetical protein